MKKKKRIEEIKKNTIEVDKKGKKEGKSKKFNKKVLLLLICVVVFCFSLYKLGSYYYDIYRNEKLVKELQEKVLHNGVTPTEEDEKEITEVKEIFSVDFAQLKEINTDIRGWIRFNDDKVNYPIVQAKDNTYYLTHSFNKKSNSVGSIFMDYRNQSFEDSNVVLFGHNTANNTMFGSLHNIFNKGFFDEEQHHFIEIIDEEGIHHKYEIFSYYVIEKEEYYITTSFRGAEFKSFINTIQKRSFKKFDVSVTTTDKILTLSTCNGNSGTTKRTVIHAKRVD